MGLKIGDFPMVNLTIALQNAKAKKTRLLTKSVVSNIIWFVEKYLLKLLKTLYFFRNFSPITKHRNSQELFSVS